MRNNQSPFVTLSLPPWGMMMPPQQTQPPTEPQVPARVEKAMEFLSLLDYQTRREITHSDLNPQEFKGRELAGEERDARDSALATVRKYFDGQLKLDRWEEVRYQTLLYRLLLAKMDMTRQQAPTAVIACPHCQEKPVPNCQFCLGMGVVEIRPTTVRPQQQEEQPEAIETKPPQEDTPLYDAADVKDAVNDQSGMAW